VTVTRTFFEWVTAGIARTGGCLVVGLDPRPEEMTPDERALLASDPGRALREHARRLFLATRDLVVAWKPNIAFYEAYGSAGWAALEAIIPMLREAAPVLLDAKRGDIGSTAKAYATAIFDRLGADAVTLHPLLGEDALAPFLGRAGKAVFVLARTSNPGAAELQELASDGEPLWAHIVRAAGRWCAKYPAQGGYGLVVAATVPEALAAVRRMAPDAWILAPGVGAQGADLGAALSVRWADGGGLLVPVSRAISGAADPRAAALAIVAAMRNGHAQGMEPAPAQGMEPAPAQVELADLLFDRACVRFGSFTLKSGVTSPIYIDLRRLVTYPDLMRLVARAYVEVASRLVFDRLAALPYAALPIGTAVSLAADWPLIYPRREAKDYGTQVAIEGIFEKGEVALVLDDVATRGDSKLEAFERLEAAGLVVHDVLVLIDREGGARELVEAAGKRFHAVFTLSELVAHWQASGRIDAVRAEAVHDFLNAGRTSRATLSPT